MAAPKLPQQFGPYTLRELIARGGMAEIYRATMPGVGGFEKTVAIKKILPHLAENDEFITMLIDEARIIVNISHANIAQVYDLGEIDDDYYIAMEYIHGIDLSTIAKELKEAGRTVPVEHALFIASGIAAGLHVAHNKCDDTGRPLHIVHRDVSPHNILLSYAGDVKIIDFGVAKARGKEAHTQMGVIKGKLLYMAPEQAMAKDLDGRADLFAMGLILYRMLTNHLPFEGDNEFQIYNHILSREIAPPRAFNPDIPEEVNQIVMMLLQRDPSKRYQDGYSAKVDLDRALQSVAPGYSISRLSRWVETDFSHLIERRMAQSGDNAVSPSTPSHNQMHTGDVPSWEAADWDEIDEDEDTVNVAMDSPEAQEILHRALQERERYQDLRASGEIASPPPPPWAAKQQQQSDSAPGQVPPPQSAPWVPPPSPPQAQAQPQPQPQPGPYGSGQYQTPMPNPSGQWPAPPRPLGSGQYSAAGDAGQAGPWGQPMPGQSPHPSGQFPVNQSGQHPAYGQQSGAYPVNQSGAFPVNQSGAYPVNQSGMYATPNQSGQYVSPSASGMYGAPPSPHYQAFPGPSPAWPEGQAPEAETKWRAGLLPSLGILFLLIVIVLMLAWKLFGDGTAAVEPPAEETVAAVEPTEPSPVTAAEAEGDEVAAAIPDAGEPALVDEPKPGRTVVFNARSTPEGADVFVNDALIGQTPLEVPIPWSESATPIRFELKDHVTEEMEAIPLNNFTRKVDLSIRPDSIPAETVSEEAEKPKPQPKPKRKPRPKRKSPPKKVDEPKGPAVPLLLDPSEPKKSEVPIF